MKKSEIKNYLAELAGLAAGGFASMYCDSLLVSVCPPVGIARIIGKYVVSSTIGTICGNETTKKIKDVIKSVEDLKVFVKEVEENSDIDNPVEEN